MRKYLSEVLDEAARRPPDEADSYRVKEVAAGSPAAEAGVQAGDWLIVLDGKLMDEVTDGLYKGAPSLDYIFYSPPRNRMISVRGVSPLGFRAAPTVKAMVKRGNPNRDDMWELWQQGAWSELARFCEQQLWPKTLWGRLFGQKKREPVNSPFMALYGAALVEMGNDEGWRWLDEFDKRFKDNWTLDAHL